MNSIQNLVLHQLFVWCCFSTFCAFLILLSLTEQDHTVLSGKCCGVRLRHACQMVSLGLLPFLLCFCSTPPTPNRTINFKPIYKERRNKVDFCTHTPTFFYFHVTEFEEMLCAQQCKKKHRINQLVISIFFFLFLFKALFVTHQFLANRFSDELLY